MCLLVCAIDAHSSYRLVLAANRDELFDRPALASRFWSQYPDLLAGRDVLAGGTWLGVTRSGRVAAVTNVRESVRPGPDAPSRGDLPVAFLSGDRPAAEFVAERVADGHRYAGYNLVLGDGRDWFWFSNRSRGPVSLDAGIHAISNDALGTPWPKVEQARARLRRVLDDPALTRRGPDEILFRQLFAILTDGQCNEDPAAPGPTGPRSAIFVVDGRYRTRASTVLVIDTDGWAAWREITWPERTTVDLRFRLAQGKR
jgi:uncharacterized protein with NRDE domain